MASKGKGVARENYSAKRKRGASGDDEKTGGALKSRNRSVLQFFEDEADDIDVDWTDDSDFDHDFIDDEPSTEPKVKNDMGKGQSLPLFPKSEEMEEEEFDKMMEGQYGDGSRLLHYTENKYDDKSFVDESSLPFSYKDPITWKVKCMVGRERQSVFCLMQKFVELKSLGTKLQILSAFAVEHIKGFVFIEAEKQNDVIEACKGIGNIYVSRMASVPRTDVSHYLSVQNKCREISEGMWARVKSGKYKGDLAQIVSVNNDRKRATVKLIPRIDLKAMAEKFGGGTVDKRTSTPAPTPKLISSSELEEFLPLIQYRRDRETGKVFQFFDGLMLKDGYLFKKVSLDSLNCWSVIPTEEEVLKFKVSENNESDNLGWLSQLYGEQKKKPIIRNDKGGGKGEGSSGSSVGFELYVLVCFGRKDFGVIVGTEKDDSYKILKDSPEGPTVVNVRRKDLKYGPFFDTKFTAADVNKKTLNVSDSVKVLEGPSQGKEGIVKYIYRNTVFIHDEIEEVNGGYLCCKAQMCEKIKFSYDAEKCGELGSSGFEDIASSPKSPLSPEKPWQTKENKFNRGENDGMFSIGQTLRIRVGPLKGYLCRVLAIRRMDVTVKLDSQQKILTVKSEHLSEVRGKSTMTLSEDPKSISKFDLLGTDGDSKDWLGGVGTAAGNDNWTGGLSTERSSWPSFPASSSSLQPGSNSANSLGPGDDANKENTPWESKVVADQSSSWGAADSTIAVASGHGSDWGKIESGKDSAKTSFNACASGGWENPGAPANGVEASDCWGKGKSKMDSSRDGSSWASGNDINVNRVDGETSEHSWDKKSIVENKTSSWGASTSVCLKANESTKYGLGWNNGWGDDKKADACAKICESSKLDDSEVKDQEDGWNVRKTADGGSSSGWNQSTSIAAASASSKRPDSDWGLKGDCNAPSSEMSLKQDTHLEGQGSRTLGSNDIGSKEGKESNWTGFSGSKNNWGSASANGCQKQDSDWGKKGKYGSDEAGHNQVSDLGKKGDWDSVSGHNEKKTGGNQNSNWENSGQNQASNWGKKGNWNSGSSDRDVNQNSNQIKTDDWSFGLGCASEKSDFTEGNRSNWNSESGGSGKDGNSAWGNKSTWNSGSNWGGKSNWNNGNNSTSNQSSGEDQTEINRGRGNWRGGFGGRDDSDGGFRGRGGFGGRRGGRGRSDGYGNDFTSNQSSSENQTETNDSRGNWRGGFGGRDNSDRGFRGRGGFGGRGFGGGGRSDESSFGDRNESGRCGYGGRGRGRRDWNSDSGGRRDWNNDSGGKSDWNNDSSDWNGGRGFGGGGRSDESSFGDRNESGRGGYGGRGRGRRGWNNDSGGRRDWNNDSGGKSDWNNDSGGKSDWNNDSGGSRRDWNNDSGGSRGDWKNETSASKGGWNNDSSKLSSWGGESNNEGWKNNGSSGTWKGGSDEKNQQKTWNSGNDGASNTAGILGRHPTESGGGVNSWDKGKGLNAKNTGWAEPSNQSDGWNKESEKPANSWRMSDTSGGAGWSKGTSSTSEKGSGSAWGDKVANPLDKGEAPSWGKPEDKTEECGRWGNEATNKGEASSSWGKQDEGNKGGW